VVWQEVGDGCFRRRYQRFDLNIGVVRGSDALLVFDSRSNLREADELLDELSVFGLPVRWVINSHWHFDHVFGNQRFVERSHEAVPATGAAVCADLELWGHADLPTALLDDVDSMRAVLREFYGDEQGDEFDQVVLTPPSNLVIDRHMIDLGDRGVELAHLGRGHTGNDLVAIMADAGVVFAGDLIEESQPPVYGDDSHPLDWPATVRALVDTGAGIFVPGHGDVMLSAAAATQADELAAVAALIRELHAAGVSSTHALSEAAHQWPFPTEALTDAVLIGFRTLDATPP
jgi:glyoxylase-like metal-dependent hydrolase (beta-lactamase superfamily II)